jgi:hypothetical protein
VKIALYTATQISPALDELVETYALAGVIPKPAEPRQILQAFERILTAG